MIPAGTFRAVRRPIYDALAAGGAGPLLAMLGLVPPAAFRVTPLGAPAEARDASIFEAHRARLDDRRGEVVSDVQQSLLSDPLQSMRKHFAAGDLDRFAEKVACGTE